MDSNFLPHPRSLALFCKVVDNYGDIGICWRLARQLQQLHGIAVTLWVDDLRSFQRLCPDVRIDADLQQVAGVTVRHWRDQEGLFGTVDIADIVIEFFGCNIPPGYIHAMAQCVPRPVWLNLEGLTAETWVEGCHTLPSPHPSLPLLKHFFFPGFNQRTGGLLMEADIEQQRLQFQHPDNQQARSAFLGRFGVTPAAMGSLKVSLFCYPHAPVEALFSAWQQGPQPVMCLVPEGVGGTAVERFLGQATKAGASACHGALTVLVVPFVTQPEYDRLLWSCDLNFVRGEDSFVRAQLADRPFVWHIYPQDENLHHVKLRAFLHVHSASTPALAALTLAWNEVANDATTGQDWPALWHRVAGDLPELARIATPWQRQLLANGDLASNLLQFAQTLTPK
jgi:uncharacterized repeat protein (TIGR03837 family)